MTTPRNLGNLADNVNSSGQLSLSGISPTGSTSGQALTSAGGVGAVRIIWGANRAFPSTNTGNL